MCSYIPMQLHKLRSLPHSSFDFISTVLIYDLFHIHLLNYICLYDVMQQHQLMTGCHPRVNPTNWHFSFKSQIIHSGEKKTLPPGIIPN